jgi:release factor glutamine methyltransferase
VADVTPACDTYRPATAADAAAIAELVAAAYGHYVARIAALPGPMRDDYAAVIATREVTVAERDGRLAGVLVLAWTDAGCCLENVAVAPAEQGRGLGGRLIDRAEAAAAAAGHDSIHLYTHELMTENIARYQRRGYVEYDRRREDGLTRVFLRKSLGTSLRKSLGKSLGTDAPVVARLRAAGCVFAEDEAALLTSAATGADLDAMIERRCAGEPLEYILGWVSFLGLRIALEPGVFVPRRRTEFLAELAIGFAQPRAVAVELCCGAAAIGAALTGAVAGLKLFAGDIDPIAVRCAQRNLPGAYVYQGDLFDGLPASLRGRVGVLAANVPYVPSAAIQTMPPEARDHEPRRALDGGADGLDVARRVAAAAPRWLAPGGHLLIETSGQQAPVAAAAFTAAGLTARIASDDERGATVVIGRH